jgi:hypothetical protein
MQVIGRRKTQLSELCFNLDRKQTLIFPPLSDRQLNFDEIEDKRNNEKIHGDR